MVAPARIATVALATAAAPALVLSCRSIAGIKPIAYVAAGADAMADASEDTGHTPPADASSDSGDAGADACAPGTMLFTVPDTLNQIAVQSGEVFVGTTLGVLGCPTTGCSSSAPTVASVPAQSSVTWGGFTVNGLIYYTLTGNPTGGPDGGVVPGQLRTVHLDGTSNQPFGSLLAAPYPYLITQAVGDVFWINDPNQPTGSVGTSGATLYACTLSGTCNPNAWGSGFGHVYMLFADPMSNPSNLYILANDPQSASMAASLFSCPLPSSASSPACGATPHVVVTNVDTTLGTPYTFTSDGTYVYGSDAANAQVSRWAISGSDAEEVLVKTDDPPVSMTFDTTDLHLYWATEGGNVMRAAPDGTDVQTLACDQFGASLIATDAQSVYLVEQSSDSVVIELPKPPGP